jgi:hypothetical protein
MTPLAVRRWRGLNALVREAVEYGSRAVERVHVATARRPFAILERIPVVAVPVRGVRLVHDAVVAVVYGAVRQVGRTVATTVDRGLELAERVGGRLGREIRACENRDAIRAAGSNHAPPLGRDAASVEDFSSGPPR